MRYQPRRPAAGIVLQPREPFEYLVVMQRVVPSSQRIPFRRHWPLRRHIDLLLKYTGIPVRQIKHLAGLRPVSQRMITALYLIIHGAVLKERIEPPRCRHFPPGAQQHIGPICTRRWQIQRDFRFGKKVALANNKSQALVTITRINESAGDRRGYFVSVVYAVATGELVFPEQLCRIEHGFA